MKADLHMHSTISDGSDTIEGLVARAKAAGLWAIGITEHDTLAHLGRLPVDADLQIIGGVELSAIHRESGVKAHVLGYRIQKPELVETLTVPLLEARNRNSEKQVEILMDLGYVFAPEQLPRADGKYLYKQHIMEWLYQTGQVSERFGIFYQQMFKNGGPCDFDIAYIDAFDAVQAVKEAGGLAVLAHPGQQKNFSLIPKLVELGLDGLELNHHAHNEDDKHILRDYARRYGLFLTGGSDYHGKYAKAPSNIGDFLSEKSGVSAICSPHSKPPEAGLERMP